MELSAQQKASLCDSLAQLQGGYGRMVTCHVDGGPLTEGIVLPSQAACIRQFGLLTPTCAATVAQLTSCAMFDVSCAPAGTPESAACTAVDDCSPSPGADAGQ